MPLAIETRSLVKRFSKVEAVRGVDLEVGRGEIFGLLGPNGAGKTTTIHILVTIHRPTSGWAKVDGFDVVRHPRKVRQRIGIVFQEPSLDTILTARENLELHARLYGVPPGETKERVQRMLRLVGLEERADTLVKTFSGGMKRRLEIARGLLHNPSVLFLDEPTLGLDPQAREHVWRYIENLRETLGTTILLTTHYMEEADALSDRIAIMDRGRIVALGTPKELKSSLQGDVVRLSAPSFPPLGEILQSEGVKRAEVVGKDLVLTVEDASRRLPSILQRIPHIERVELHTPTLEDVFLSLTGREMRDESVDESPMEGIVRHMLGGGDHR